jgi:hypothetical protein
MCFRPRFLAAFALGGCLVSPLVQAADPSQQRPIAGQDVMGDKSRSGPDGWSWAPIARTQAASGRAPGQTEANQTKANMKASREGTTLPPGQDPGTPAATTPNGPGTLDAPSVVAKP